MILLGIDIEGLVIQNVLLGDWYPLDCGHSTCPGHHLATTASTVVWWLSPQSHHD